MIEKEDNNKQGERCKKCFIVTPIGSVGSETFRKMAGVLESVIKPVLKEYGFEDIKAAHEISEPGSINTQIIERIVNDDLVIANLTGNNPNVMYELCLRHVTAKPLITICENGTTLPFDIYDNRTIFFEDDMLGVSELKSNLAKMLQSLDYSKEYYDNPIYKGLKVGNILKSIPDTNDKNLVLLQEILDKVNKLEKNKSYQIKKQSYDILIDGNSIRGDINLASTQLGMFGYKVIAEDNTIYISNIESEDLYQIENVLKLNNMQYMKYKAHGESL